MTPVMTFLSESLTRVAKALFISAILCGHLWARGEACRDVSAEQKTELTKYVRAKYKLPENLTFDLASVSPVDGTCFHRLAFKGQSSVKKWDMVLYLSPDGRYLSTEMFDTKVDPVEEERANARMLMAALSENKGTSRGQDAAPVTIVEFSDFECPYCRKFSSIMDEVLPSMHDTVRVVFHHLPLSIHPWAKAAAEAAACAQLQDSKVFWAMHDKIFQEQPSLTVADIKTRLSNIARSTPGLDYSNFQACVDNQMSLGLVFRDMNLASANQVTATPTLFINGHRVQGVKDANQLRQYIAEALKETTERPEARLAAVVSNQDQ